MTNKEKYQRTFSALHTSAGFEMEVSKMKKTRKTRVTRLVILSAAIVLLLGLTSVAYASNLGGIQRTVQIWLHGDQTAATLVVEQGDHTSYSATYEDDEGNTHEIQGGGVAYDFFGREKPLSEEDILEQLNAPDVVYNDDGSVWVYYYEQKLDITDKFDEDGVCYVQLNDGGRPLYMTVKYQGGYATGTNRYPNPRHFN